MGSVRSWCVPREVLVGTGGGLKLLWHLRRVIARCSLLCGFIHSGLPVVLVRSHKTWRLVKGVVELECGEHLA